MYLYRATRDPFLINLGEDMLESIEFSTKTVCGYATVKVILAKLVNLLIIIYWHVTHG
jgi:mannosidase alpha-like ER degradation enhancer 2